MTFVWILIAYLIVGIIMCMITVKIWSNYAKEKDYPNNYNEISKKLMLFAFLIWPYSTIKALKILIEDKA